MMYEKELIIGDFDNKKADVIIGNMMYIIRDLKNLCPENTCCGVNLNRVQLVGLTLSDLSEDLIASLLPCLMDNSSIPPAHRLVEIKDIDLRGIQWRV